MKQKLNKIFLVGYMGAGKSYLGRILAKKLNYRFVDTDNLIEEVSGKSIASIFEQDGEDHFRKLESDTIAQLETESDIVIATGGGLPCHRGNMQALLESGTVIYLNVDIKLLINRLLEDVSIRPIINNFGSRKELAMFVITHIKEREKVYNLAHHIVDINKNGLEYIDDLIKLVGNKNDLGR